MLDTGSETDRTTTIDLVRLIKLGGLKNVSEDLFCILKRLIISERLSAGYRFPNENVFCEMLNISRSSLREAYGKLDALNLVIRSRAGTQVNDPKHIASINSFNSTLEKTELYELLEYRSILECEICVLAAARITDDELYTLTILQKNMKTNKENKILLTHYDTQFHFVISEASKNSLLKHSIDMIYPKYIKVVFQAFSESSELADNAIMYHSKILEALYDRSPILAREVMKEHMSDVYKHINGSK